MRDNELHTKLKEALAAAISIPLECADAVIYGEGFVELEGDNIVVDYFWNEAVPYADSRDKGAGRVTLIAVQQSAE